MKLSEEDTIFLRHIQVSTFGEWILRVNFTQKWTLHPLFSKVFTHKLNESLTWYNQSFYLDKIFEIVKYGAFLYAYNIKLEVLKIYIDLFSNRKYFLKLKYLSFHKKLFSMTFYLFVFSHFLKDTNKEKKLFPYNTAFSL